MKSLIMFLSLSIVSFSAMSFEHFQVGPSLKVIDIAHPLQAGVEVRALNGYLGVSLHKGLMPEIGVSGYDIKIDNFDVGLKYHPWKGSFYTGVLIGSQKVGVKKTEVIQGQSVDFEGSVKSSYVTPQVGWQWQFSSGLFLGMQVGWQLNSGSKTNVVAKGTNALIEADQEYKDTKADIEKEGNNLGNKSIPNVGLLQIGWMF